MKLEWPGDEIEGWPDVRARIKDPRLGATVTIYKRRGRLVARASTQRPSPAALKASEPYRRWLHGAVLAWKYLHPALKEPLVQAARRHHITARDFFIALLAGSLLTITDEQGNTYYPLRARNYVGKALDLITNVPGALLVRDVEQWRGLVREMAGDLVLGWMDGEPTPRWIAMPTGAGGMTRWDLVIEPQPPAPIQGWQVFDVENKEIVWSGRGVTIYSRGTSGTAIGGVRIPLQYNQFRAEVILVGDLYSRTNYLSALVGIMDGDTGRIESVGWGFFMDGVEVVRWNNQQSWNSTIGSVVIGAGLGNRVCLAVEDDGTNVRYEYSVSGAYWRRVSERPSRQFVQNPGYFVIGINPQGGVPLAVTAIHCEIKPL